MGCWKHGELRGWPEKDAHQHHLSGAGSTESSEGGPRKMRTGTIFRVREARRAPRVARERCAPASFIGCGKHGELRGWPEKDAHRHHFSGAGSTESSEGGLRKMRTGTIFRVRESTESS